ncbi:alpha/beta hydrolase [Levilactobacillus suantsaii]|uniref:Alpha/beta hydrolase n=1 Tax=Levilactobacillus suantsaii TaxID=2292255 RepID=A0A4Q0VGX8_9LACO|nr:alpha/beta hydrolase [Levilactobacillus suantsaii]QMU09076.1 alpha/beta hydrolase [Levilactobacillus suantsaii]RXI78313.1 alpha/beta hydrolase [Levilactobacillus suantsaii]
MTKKKKIGIATALAATSLVSLFGSSLAVYRLGMKSFSSSRKKSKERSIAENTSDDNAWYLQQPIQEWTQVSQDGLTLRASFIPAESPKSDKVAILAHGLGHSREQMIPYARVFRKWGYSLLMPDARAHGESEGNTIGYGWLDRHDYQGWIAQLLERCGQQIQIVLMGVSMGASTVLATAGEDLPANVKAVVADSGYASVFSEGGYRLWHKYHIPTVPAMTLANQYSRVDAGYRLRDGNIAAQLHHTKLPILFIQGAHDQTVPIENLDILYQAAAGPKQKYRHPSAAHIATRAADPATYDQKVAAFLAPYVDSAKKD